MKLLRVIGLGLAIIMLRILIPRVWTGFEESLVQFFEFTSAVFDTGEAAVGKGLF